MRRSLIILLLLFQSITFANEDSLIENYMEELENVDDETFVDVEQMADELTELLAHGIELNTVDESFLKKNPKSTTEEILRLGKIIRFQQSRTAWFILPLRL